MQNRGKDYFFMKMQRVMLDGYKNLADVNITFRKITALVALNNFGKSNILSGIAFGIDFMKCSEGHRRELMGSDAAVPANKELLDKNFKYEIEMTTTIGADQWRIVYGFEFCWLRTDSDEPNIVNEYLKAKVEEGKQRYSQIVNRCGDKAFYKSAESGRCSTPLKVGRTELVINKLKAFDQLYYIEIIQRLNDLQLYMENSLDPKRFYEPKIFIDKGMLGYTVNDNNLPKVIAKLKQSSPEKFNLLLDTFRSLFPEVEDIVVRELQITGDGEVAVPDDVPFIVSDSIYLLFVRDKNLCKLINFGMMSDGAKRVFMILTRIIIAGLEKRNVSLVAIEEPENSIHPSLFRAYLQIIDNLLEDCKVIVTSHSPYVVNFLELESIYVGVLHKCGVARFCGFDKKREKMLMHDADACDMGTGDYIFSLLADDESELENYLECDDIG